MQDLCDAFDYGKRYVEIYCDPDTGEYSGHLNFSPPERAMTNAELFALVFKEKHKYMGDRPATTGDCSELAAILADAIPEAKKGAGIVVFGPGPNDYALHCWVQLPNGVLDPTVEQFPVSTVIPGLYHSPTDGNVGATYHEYKERTPEWEYAFYLAQLQQLRITPEVLAKWFKPAHPLNFTCPAAQLAKQVRNVNPLAVPQTQLPRSTDRKVLAQSAREVFRQLGLKGISVTVPRHAGAQSVDIRYPARDDYFVRHEDGMIDFPNDPVARSNARTAKTVEAILDVAFPHHKDRSKSIEDYYDYRWSVMAK